jgi:hypothetical protein
LVSIVGVIILLASQAPHLVFPAAAMGAVSAAYSMASGDAMGQTQTHWAAVPVMAASTFAGTVAPALPFLWTSGWMALAQSGAIALLIALLVGYARSWRKHRYIETVAIIGFGVALTVACNLLVPGGSA